MDFDALNRSLESLRAEFTGLGERLAEAASQLKDSGIPIPGQLRQNIVETHRRFEALQQDVRSCLGETGSEIDAADLPSLTHIDDIVRRVRELRRKALEEQRCREALVLALRSICIDHRDPLKRGILQEVHQSGHDLVRRLQDPADTERVQIAGQLLADQYPLAAILRLMGDTSEADEHLLENWESQVEAAFGKAVRIAATNRRLILRTDLGGSAPPVAASTAVAAPVASPPTEPALAIPPPQPVAAPQETPKLEPTEPSRVIEEPIEKAILPQPAAESHPKPAAEPEVVAKAPVPDVAALRAVEPAPATVTPQPEPAKPSRRAVEEAVVYETEIAARSNGWSRARWSLPASTSRSALDATGGPLAPPSSRARSLTGRPDVEAKPVTRGWRRWSVWLVIILMVAVGIRVIQQQQAEQAALDEAQTWLTDGDLEDLYHIQRILRSTQSIIWMNNPAAISGMLNKVRERGEALQKANKEAEITAAVKKSLGDQQFDEAWAHVLKYIHLKHPSDVEKRISMGRDFPAKRPAAVEYLMGMSEAEFNQFRQTKRAPSGTMEDPFMEELRNLFLAAAVAEATQKRDAARQSVERRQQEERKVQEREQETRKRRLESLSQPADISLDDAIRSPEVYLDRSVRFSEVTLFGNSLRQSNSEGLCFPIAARTKGGRVLSGIGLTDGCLVCSEETRRFLASVLDGLVASEYVATLDCHMIRQRGILGVECIVAAVYRIEIRPASAAPDSAARTFEDKDSSLLLSIP